MRPPRPVHPYVELAAVVVICAVIVSLMLIGARVAAEVIVGLLF